MNVSVSNSVSNSPSSEATAPVHFSINTHSSDALPSSTAAAGDSVKLSQAAQVHLMKQQGQGLSQIAADLGISTTAVDGYLGIAVAKAPAAAAPAPATPVAAQTPAPAPTESGATK